MTGCWVLNKQLPMLQLSCVESLCKSPYASESLLARNAFSLLKREEATDMVFEVISVQGLLLFKLLLFIQSSL